MRRHVCVKCEVQMRCEKNGVVVAEMYMDNKEIYRLWNADKYKCPICWAEVVVGFAEHPHMHAVDGDCKVELARSRERGAEVVYDKEVKG